MSDFLINLATSLRDSGKIKASFWVQEFSFMGNLYPAVFICKNNNDEPLFDCILLLLGNHLCINSANVIEMNMDLYMWHGILPGSYMELCNPNEFDVDKIIDYILHVLKNSESRKFIKY